MAETNSPAPNQYHHSSGDEPDKYAGTPGWLEKEQIDLFEEACFLSWNSQLVLAEEKIKSLASTQALFALLYAKIGVVRAIISESEPECEDAFQRLDNATKLSSTLVVEEGWFSVS